MAAYNPFIPEEEMKATVGLARPGVYGMPMAPTRKFNTPVTPKENFLRMCRNEKPLWMPNMGAEFNMLQPEVMPDAYARIHGGVDWFGIEWEYEPRTQAGMVKPGTRRLSSIVNWEKELVWPDLKAIDWEADYKQNYEPVMDPSLPTLFIIVNGYFERLADLTSFADTFCYLLEEEDAIKAFYDKLTDFHIELMKIAKDYYHADLITFHDDMGSQKNAFMSPSIFREILMPQYQKLNKAAHDMGLYVNFHSCGNVGIQLENFAESGFDFWEGQDNCNDKQALMDKCGDKIGQVSIFMPDADLSDEDYEKAITERVTQLGKTGRYIPWFVDIKPGRAEKGEDLIYSISRKFYSK